jgi:hypothetical protein
VAGLLLLGLFRPVACCCAPAENQAAGAVRPCCWWWCTSALPFVPWWPRYRHWRWPAAGGRALVACCYPLAVALVAGILALLVACCWPAGGGGVAGGAGLLLAHDAGALAGGRFTAAQFSKALLFIALQHGRAARDHAAWGNRWDAINFILAWLPVWISASTTLLLCFHRAMHRHHRPAQCVVAHHATRSLDSG